MKVIQAVIMKIKNKISIQRTIITCNLQKGRATHSFSRTKIIIFRVIIKVLQKQRTNSNKLKIRSRDRASAI